MHASAKYLIHADIRTNGVVERSDVVGAIFGQTEGLLGEGLDLRDLQDSSKVGRIDVDIESEGGRSFGTVTIASGLDRVETAVLAASLETIERVGPCRADCTITHIEDARAAKRRELIGRATELLTDLEEATVTSEQLVEEVRQQARIEEITEYRGYPAGPRVEDSDAIIVVEGRADVRRLLKYGIKTAVAVEGTDVPSEIAELTSERKTTAFLDGDRGGDLILRELRQVGDVDYVAFAPADQSVEDLDRRAILSALRRKIPLEQIEEGQTAREAFAPPDALESVTPAVDGETTETPPADPAEEGEPVDPGRRPGDDDPAAAAGDVPPEDSTGDVAGTGEPVGDGVGEPGERVAEGDGPSVPAGEGTSDGAFDDGTREGDPDDRGDTADDPDRAEPPEPETLPGHVEAVIGEDLGIARFLDGAFDVVDEVDAGRTFETLADGGPAPETVVIDGVLTQRVLDVAAQRGVGQVVAADTEEFVKQPTSVRVRTVDDFEVTA